MYNLGCDKSIFWVKKIYKKKNFSKKKKIQKID
jgi:hypothetical protein